ncbi:MAG: S-layer homology domain-containing protein [Peptococcaceae bacterium]|nr:S-layer homology domain-containing protein [Peptococcaceae bacterium]
MNCVRMKILPLLLALLLVMNILPFSAPAAEGITCNVEKEGTNVTIRGNTFPGSLVSLVVTRSIDGSRSYLDQTSTGQDGSYSFSFALDGGDYRATVSCNGLHRQCDIKIKTSDTKTVTVRVEGKTATRLPRTEVSILAGETTLFDAITSALDSTRVKYDVANGLIHAIAGEEGWQWLINNRGGMYLPTTTLFGGEEIVLVDDLVWNPTITRLTVSPAGVKAGETFTVTLEKLSGDYSAPATGQPVLFNGEARITDGSGRVTFTPGNKGIFSVTCEPVDPSLIRPVPVLVNVTGSGGTTAGSKPAGGDISVRMRIEGYRGTVMDGYVTFKPEDYKGGDGKYRFTGPDGVEYVNDRATVLLATVVAWNQNGIRDNRVTHNDNYVARMAGEEEFDFRGKHITSGWLVRVNNNLINQGVGVWPVKDGDRIEWYYGDVNSYFGTMEVSPTSLNAGDSIKVKVFGQSNGGMSMSNTGRKEPMEGAAVYVGTQEYTTGSNGEAEITMNNPGTYEIYAVKLDKDSSSGGHYFPLMSRTEKVIVTVSGKAVTEVPVPENPSDAAGVIKKVLETGSPAETLVAEAVKAAARSLANGLKKVKTAGDANKLFNDTAAVTALLGSAADRINSGDPALTFAGACAEIAGVLAGLAPQVSGGDGKKTLEEAAAQTIDSVAKVMAVIADRGKLQETAHNLLDSVAKTLAFLEREQARTLGERALNMARQAVRRMVRETLAGETEGDLLRAVISPDLAGELAGNAVRVVAELEQKLARMGIGEDLQKDRRAIIDVPPRGEKAVEITLSAGTLETVASSGTVLVVNTSAASFAITPDAFGPGARGRDLVLRAARVGAGDMSGTEIPPGSAVVDLEAMAGDQRIDSFSSPMEVGIPYPGTPQNPAAAAVFLLRGGGGLEPAGGVYDPATGMVKFLADRLGKYLARESVKQFSDLAGHPWAVEAVEVLAGKGIINGKGENYFDPGANITRAEFAVLAARMLKCGTPEGADLPFKDVDEGAWYRRAVAAAHAGGLVSGVAPDRFEPEGNITRQEMAVIIARVLLKKGYKNGKSEDLAAFRDRTEMASWAEGPAALAVREGIISGVGGGRFAPRDRATRAEAAVMLHKLYGLMLR